MEIGVPLNRMGDALERVLAAARQVGVFPGVIAIRYVPHSNALLAFTRYPMTCTMEFQMAQSDLSDEFQMRVISELDGTNVPYTFHWGQVGDFSAERVSKCYGNDATRWIKCREKLLSSEARKVFTSDFLKHAGLG